MEKQGSEQKILEYFLAHHPQEAARILEKQNIDRVAQFVGSVPPEMEAKVYAQLDSQTAARCLEAAERKAAARIIECLPVEIASLLLRRASAGWREAILNALQPESAAPLRQLLEYPEHSSGAIMDPLVLTLPQDIRVEEAFSRVQKRPDRAMYYVYVLRRNHSLAGVINLRELMLAESNQELSAIMHTNVFRLNADDNLRDIITSPGWKDYHTLPVVNHNDVFVGVIRYQTLRKLEQSKITDRGPVNSIRAGDALGELFRIGLSGFVRSAIKQESPENK